MIAIRICAFCMISLMRGSYVLHCTSTMIILHVHIVVEIHLSGEKLTPIELTHM